MYLVCEFCCEPFKSNRKKRFCGKECQLSRRRICKGCEKPFVCKRQGRSEFCTLECANRFNNQWAKGHICLWCARVFKIKTRSSRNDGKYCSRECAFEHWHELKAIRKVQSEGDRWLAGLWKICECSNCNKVFFSQQTKSHLCSRKCSISYYNPPVPLREMQCRQCGNVYQGKGQPVCSSCVSLNRKAASKAAKIRRKYQLTSTQVEPIGYDEIFDRDGWLCQECGVSVSREFDVNDDRYPNLDHIIPLAKGGTHTKENVRCTCRKCNIEKADKVLTLF